MDNRLTIDGKALNDFGVWVTDAGIYQKPQTDIQTIEIEGRNGELTIDRGRYKNVAIRYPAVIYRNFGKNFEAMNAFLMSEKGYRRIEESFDPETYRMGRFRGGLKPKFPPGFELGRFDLEFDCMPQKWLKSGEKAITVTDSVVLYNPTLETANPLIRVWGYGTLTVGDNEIVIVRGASRYVDIDCEIKDCFEGANNRNGLVTMTGWPVLKTGTNQITVADGIIKAEITPRWWTI